MNEENIGKENAVWLIVALVVSRPLVHIGVKVAISQSIEVNLYNASFEEWTEVLYSRTM